MSYNSNETADVRRRTVTLTTSERHSLLSAERRRLALDVLAGRTTPIDLEELAAAVAARDDGGGVDETTVERTKIALHHTHLPKMADLGVLNYDPKSHQILPDGALIDSIRHGCPER